MKGKNQNDLDFRFMQKTLRSLAPRHTEVLKAFAQLQLNIIRKSKSIKWAHSNDCVQYKEFKEKFVKEMIHSSDTDLKDIMIELRDHGIIVKKVDHDKEDIVSIPTTRSNIKLVILLRGVVKSHQASRSLHLLQKKT